MRDEVSWASRCCCRIVGWDAPFVGPEEVDLAQGMWER